MNRLLFRPKPLLCWLDRLVTCKAPLPDKSTAQMTAAPECDKLCAKPGRCCAYCGLVHYTPDNSTLSWSPGLTISHIITLQYFEVFII